MPSGSLNRAPVNRDASFLEPSFHYLSQFLVNGPPPQVPQQDPYGERHPSAEPSTSHPLKIHLSLRVPVKEAPSMFCKRVPMDRYTLSPQPLSIYSCMSARVPKKQPSYKMGKNIRSPSMGPHADGWPTYNGVRPGSLRGSLMTLSLPQCHAALGMIPSTLAWVHHSPVPACVVASPIRVYPPQLLPHPM